MPIPFLKILVLSYATFRFSGRALRDIPKNGSEGDLRGEQSCYETGLWPTYNRNHFRRLLYFP